MKEMNVVWKMFLWLKYKFNVWCANNNRMIFSDDMPYLTYLKDKEADATIQALKNEYEKAKQR